MQEQVPADFITALDSLKGQSFRPELHIEQIPGPTQIAPWAVALQCEINDSPDKDPDFLRGSAKFVVLYDPAGQPAWNGQFRVIIHAQAGMDNEIGADPLLGEVAWSWLDEALDRQGASHHSRNGTVTRVFNETFGGMHLDLARIDLQLRASWTPQRPVLTNHLLAWADFVATMSGLAPVGVRSLGHKVEKI